MQNSSPQLARSSYMYFFAYSKCSTSFQNPFFETIREPSRTILGSRFIQQAGRRLLQVSQTPWSIRRCTSRGQLHSSQGLPGPGMAWNAGVGSDGLTCHSRLWPLAAADWTRAGHTNQAKSIRSSCLHFSNAARACGCWLYRLCSLQPAQLGGVGLS